MKITATDFDYNFHESKEITGQGQNYTLHRIDVFNVIQINGKDYDAIYQTACSYINNVYGLPNPKLELSPDGGTSEFICTIDDLHESDLTEETFANLKENYDFLESLADLKKIYEFLNDNLPEVNYYADLHKEQDEGGTA